MTNQDIPEKVLSLLKKLHALSERGVGGEKENATDKLLSLMSKHNVSLDDIVQDAKRPCTYWIALRHQDLFFNILYEVLNVNKISYRKSRKDKKSLTIDLSISEEMQVTAMFMHYAADFDRQYYEMTKNFSTAYVHSNRIAYDTPKSDKPMKPLTQKDLDRIAALQKLANAIEPNTFKKQLTA
jgi:hypothetical protein